MRGNKSNDRLIIILGLFAIFTVHSCGPISPEDDAASDNAGAISGGAGTADDETRGGIDRHDRDDLEDEAADSDDEDRTDGMMPVAGHTVDLSGTGILHASGLEDPVNNCTACHGADLLGAGAAPSCLACHGRVWESEDGQPSGHDVPLGATETLHRAGLYDPLANCAVCHGAELEGGVTSPSCTRCHGQLWSAVMLPVDHVVELGMGVLHRAGLYEPVDQCAACHGADLMGTGSIPSCTACHAQVWQSTGEVPISHILPKGAAGILHAVGLADPTTHCTACHGADLLGNGGIPSCTQCHGPLWLTAGPPFDHTVPLGNPEVFHRSGLTAPESNCSVCHGALLSGTASAPSCTLCHGALWESAGGPPASHTVPQGVMGILHLPGFDDPTVNCTACHGTDLSGAGVVPSCTLCHSAIWESAGGPPASHTVPQGAMGILHLPGFDDPTVNCTACHGADLSGAGVVPSCTLCHSAIWESAGGPPASHTVAQGAMGILHQPGFDDPTVNCTACHGADLSGAGVVPSCTLCHSAIWESAGGPPASHTVPQGAMGILHQPGFDDPTVNCTACHGADLSGAGVVPSCTLCHGPLWDGGDISGSHDIAVGNPAVLHRDGLYDPLANCTTCHGVALNGTSGVPACWVCHGSIWDAAPDYPPDHTISKDGNHHAAGLESPVGQCDACHGADLMGTPLIPSCTLCHGVKWDEGGDDSDDD